LIGLLDPKDVWHEPATALKGALIAHGANVAVFDCVLAEAISTLARRIHEQRRTADLDRLVARLLADYPMDDILWVLPDVPVLYGGIVELVRSSGGALNFNDALIALSCRHREIPFIASFDRDFDQLAWLKRVAQPDNLS
jgi:predicted nucleic acid-binding protein